MKSLSRKNWFFFSIVLVGSLLWGFLTLAPQKKEVHPPQEDKTLAFITETRQASSGLISRQTVIMGSEFSFMLEASEEVALNAIQKIVNRLHALESQLTSWHAGGDIARVNEQAGIAPTVVSPETFKLLSLAKQIHQDTGGTFDITMGAIGDLWSASRPLFPSQAELMAKLTLVNAALIEMNPKIFTVFLPQRGMKIDLGGIEKGYVAEVALQTMRELGIHQAAVQVEGTTYLLGHKTTGPWVITIEDPHLPEKVVERFIAGEGAVATVGTHEDYFVKEGKWFSRILDPKTGSPVVQDCQSVTIITKEWVLAKAYATAIFMMGTQAGLAWVEKQAEVAALIVDTQDQIHVSSQWAQMTQPFVPLPSITKSPSTSEVPKSLSLPAKIRTPPKNLLRKLEDRALDLQTGEMLKIPEGKHQPAFLIDRTEVTNQQYQRFLEATAHHPHEFCHPDEPRGKDHTPRYWREYRSLLFRNTVAAQLAPFHQETFKQADHPVVGVDWWDAYSFARWAGKRLPTQAEWKRAACGTDGRLWPWGNQWDYKKANTGGEKWNEQDGFVYSAPAVSFLDGASPDQILNLAGNVSEWTQEGYVMGGSSKSSPTGVSCQAPDVLWEPEFRSFDIGFRCAAEMIQ